MSREHRTGKNRERKVIDLCFCLHVIKINSIDRNDRLLKHTVACKKETR